MSKENKYLTNSETNEMVAQIKIDATIKQLEGKLSILENMIASEREKLYWCRERRSEYKPNSCGLVQGVGLEIDNLCGRLGALYEMKDVISGKTEI